MAQVEAFGECGEAVCSAGVVSMVGLWRGEDAWEGTDEKETLGAMKTSRLSLTRPRRRAVRLGEL